MRSFFQIAFAFLTATAVSIPGIVIAQDSPNPIGSAYIPGDAMATIVVSVADTMNSPMAEMYPTEIADAWCEQNIGVKARDIDRIKVVLSAPGPQGPMIAVVVASQSEVDLGAINPQFVNTSQQIDVAGHACYPVAGPAGMVLHAKDSKTIVIASRDYLDSVVQSAETSDTRGRLASMADGVAHAGNVTALIAMEPIRPMAMGMLQQNRDKIPQPFEPFTKVPELLDAVLLRVDLENKQNGLNLVMLGRDDAAAQELMGIIGDGLKLGRQIALSQAMNELQGDDPLAEATQQYAQRMSNRIVEMLTPTLDGRRLSLSGSLDQGMATQGVLVSLLLPAVQAAREAARRTSSANNLKQIAVAMHNGHAVGNHFPADAKAGDGTPLLSWRVAILPYLDEVELYDQFHMDEPWDSPHNLKLAEQMPMVFQHPAIASAPGTTVYQRPAGENYINAGTEPIGFRDIIDGTSNTIMVVETLGHAAVPWTKPADVEIDVSDPLADLVDGTRQGFNAVFGDGSVRFIANGVDPAIFRALLTRNGGEVVQP